MKIIRTKDYMEMSHCAATILMEQIKANPRMVLGLATGSSPLGIYECLAKAYKKNEICMKEVVGFNLDEYIGLTKSAPQSFHYYLQEHLIKPTDFPEDSLHVLDGMTKDVNQECEQYEKMIALCGGVDLQILGLGDTGHVGFNEPNTHFVQTTNMVHLDQETVKANSRFFSRIEDVPTSALTMGIGTIMRAKKIIMVVSGKSKADVLYKALYGEVTPLIPASILQFHPDVTVVVDEEAYTEISKWSNRACNGVTALGELLIDFTESGKSPQGNDLLEVNPGGAPCNVLAMLQKLGDHTAFIGKVGNDQFGKMLKERIKKIGICTENLILDKKYSTTLTFVKTLEGGDREFSFYRNPGADMMLTKEEIQEGIIRNSHIFHYGTLSMTHEGVREATQYAIEVAEKAGCLRSFDPNLRPPLWDSLEEAREQINYGLSHCDILKISEEELEFVTDEVNIDQGVDLLKSKFDITLICVTCGSKGSSAYYKDIVVQKKAYTQENTIETTGAGDTFGASILHYILQYGINSLNRSQLEEMLTFANAAAAIITTRKGALGVMPTEQEVLKLIGEI